MQIARLLATETADFCRLIAIFNNVFERKPELPGEAYLGKLLANANFMAFVVRIDGKVVGGLTLYVLHQYYSERPLAYLYDVGIETAFQGQGLGQALMAEVSRFCADKGFEAAYVEAEADDAAAIAFYRKTQADSELQAVHFTYIFG